MKRAALLLVISGCTVPDLDALGKKRCDLDAGHPCVDGYACVAGFCEAADGGPCTGDQTQACGLNKGECKPGLMKCSNGMFGPCEGAVGPTDEICDGKDNNCDGTTDENLFDGRPCEKDAGVCAGAHHACVNGHYEQTCTGASYGSAYQAVESLCDGKDNDCNGMTDEAGAGACPDAGVCAGHLLACMSAMPGLCMAQGYETVEMTCDGLDNDCNGLTDEGLVSMTSCGLQKGVCAGKKEACVNGAFEEPCTTVSYGPTYQPVETLCDGLDNDCDGLVDRAHDGGVLGSAQLCELQAGVCLGATRACTDGGLELPCTALSYGPVYAPLDLSCDGLDHDCDGLPDRSGDRLLVGGPGPQSHLAIAPGAGGLAYEDSASGTPHVLFQRGGMTMPISDAAASSTNPALAPLAGFTVIAWLDNQDTINAAGVTATGSVMWRATVQSGKTVFTDSLRMSSSTTEAVLVWIDGATASLQGAVVDSQGHVSVQPTLLSPAGDQVFSADLSWSGSLYNVGWSALAGGGSWFARFKVVTNTLSTLAGPSSFGNDGGTVGAVRVSPGSFAWISNDNVVNYRGADGGIQLASVPGTASDLAIVDAAQLWVIDGKRLMAHFTGGSLLEITPDAGIVSLAGTQAVPDQSAVFVGYEIDKGTSTGLDVDYQSICPR